MVHELNCTHPLASEAGNVSTSEILSLLLEEERQEFLLKFPALIFMIIYVFLGIPGNILVIIVYYFRFRESTSKTFIMSLSTFDLISCVLGIPFEMVDLRYDLELDVPVACKLFRSIITFCACGSTLILLSVAADRFRRICLPFKRQMSVRQSKFVLGFMTLISAIISSPALVLYGRNTKIYKDVTLVECTIDDEWAKTNFANGYQFILGMLWISSILVLCVMYGVIIYKIRKQEIRRLNLTSNSFASLHVSKLYTGTSSNLTQSRNVNLQVQDRSDVGSSSSDFQSSYGNKTPLQNKNAVEQNSNNQEDRRSLENGKGLAARRPNSLNRLFSRDANPIFEEEDEANKASKIYNNRQKEEDTNVKFTVSGLEEPIQEEITEDLDMTDQTPAKTNNENKSKFRAKSEYSELRIIKSSNSDLSKQFSKSLPCIQNTLIETENMQIASQNEDSKMRYSNCSKLDTELRRKRSQSLPDNKERHVYFISKYFDVNDSDISKFKRNSSEVNTCNGTFLSSYRQDDGKTPTLTNGGNNYFIENNNLKTNIETGTSNRLEVESGRKRYASDDRSLDRITSKSDETNGSILTLNNSRVNKDRHRKISAYSMTRQASFNSNGNSNDRSSRANSYCSQNSVPGRVHKTSVTSYTGKMSVASTTTRELKTSRIAVMMFYVTMGHVLSYLPHLAIQFHRALGPQSITRLLCNSVYFAFHHLLLRSIYLNNAINPIIYSYNNSQFRKYCRQLLQKPLSFCQRKNTMKSYTIDSAHSLTID